MSRWHLVALAALAFVAWTVNPARACSRRRVTTIEVGTSAQLPAVAVRIDGQAARLYVDTGAQRTILTRRAAERLKLATDFLGFLPLWGIGGLSAHFNAKVGSFRLGDIALKQHSLAVADFGGAWKSSSDGLLGDDVLAAYDVEIDLSVGQIVFYRPTGCSTPAPGWKSAYSRVPFLGVMPFDHHVITTMNIDGHPIRAVIDTGAEKSAVGRAAAQRLGASGAAIDQGRETRMIGVGNQTVSYREHVFGDMKLGAQSWRRPSLLVGELPPLLGDMLLGIDYLRTCRIWISWRNRALFVARAHDKTAFKEPWKR